MIEFKLTIFRERGRVIERTIICAENHSQALEMAFALAGHNGDEWDLLPMSEVKAAQDIEAKISTKH